MISQVAGGDAPEIDDRIDTDDDVVLGDAVLGGDTHRDDLDVDVTEPIHGRRDESGPVRPDPALHRSRPEHRAALVLLPGSHREHQARQRHGDQGEATRRKALACPQSIAASGARKP